MQGPEEKSNLEYLRNSKKVSGVTADSQSEPQGASPIGQDGGGGSSYTEPLSYQKLER